MKIQVVSDLHLEFGPISINNAGETDVLILSGDICVAKDLANHDAVNLRGEHDKSNRYHAFFQECCERFPRVIYIMGNHEHYHGDYNATAGIIRAKLNYLPNLYFLDKQWVVIDDVMFLAGTLWTDMNKEDPITLSQIGRLMNDYHIVKDSSRMVSYRTYPDGDDGAVVFKKRPSQFAPTTSVEDHKAMLQFIKEMLGTIGPNKKVVIVGHHAPSKASIKPRYHGDHIVNGAYSSDLSELMLDNPCIKLWTHGHTHDSFDYMIGSTRVFCNPRGYYNYEENPAFDPNIVLEV